MRPLVPSLALCAFFLAACQAPGPSTTVEVQPAVGVGASGFAGPEVGVGAALGSRYAGFAAVLLAGLAASQGVEFGVGVKPAIPPPDPAVVKQVEDAKAAVAEAERNAKEAGRLGAPPWCGRRLPGRLVCHRVMKLKVDLFPRA